MKKIVMYSTASCPHCKSAREYLLSKKIAFVEKDINHDAQARADLARRNVMGVPAFLVDDEIVIGFDRARLDQLISFEIVRCQSCSAKLRLPSGKGKLRVKCPQCSASFIAET